MRGLLEDEEPVHAPAHPIACTRRLLAEVLLDDASITAVVVRQRPAVNVLVLALEGDVDALVARLVGRERVGNVEEVGAGGALTQW